MGCGASSETKEERENQPDLGKLYSEVHRGSAEFFVSALLEPTIARRAAYNAEDIKQEIRETVETTVVIVEKDAKREVTFINQYMVIKTLGVGSYGKVKLTLSTQDKRLYALKIINKKALKRQRVGKNSNALEGVMQEIRIMKQLRHNNVVRLVEVMDDPMGEFLYMVIEYVDGGEVTPDKGGMTEAELVFVLRDICKGLNYLHYNKVVHRDLKPANVLKGWDGFIKIADFGVSHLFDSGDDTLSSTAGTPAFLSPEMCQDHTFHGVRADLWALGVCLYFWFYGVVPFTGEGVMEIYEAIKNTEPAWGGSDQGKVISEELKSLISGLLTKDPDARMNLQQVMKHRFTTKNGLYPMKVLGQRKMTDPFLKLESTLDELHAQVEVENKKQHEDFVSKVMLVAREVSFESGEHLIEHGKEVHEMYFIEEGVVDVLLDVKGSNFDFDMDTIEEDDMDEEEDVSEDEEEGESVVRSKTSHAVVRRSKSRCKEQDMVQSRSPRAGLIDNRFVKLAQLEKGSYIGEMAMFEVEPMPSAYVVAVEPVLALVINKDQLHLLLKEHPFAKDNILSTIRRRKKEIIWNRAIFKLQTMPDAGKFKRRRSTYAFQGFENMGRPGSF